MIKETKKALSYLIVGGGATVVEWVFYWLFSNTLGIQYMAATVLALVISTFSNWLLGRLMTFRNAEKQNIWAELGKIYAISVIGIIFNLLLMWLFHGRLGMWDMLAKVLATCIVFVYNYLIRRLVIYKK